jgi:hypothetical protein
VGDFFNNQCDQTLGVDDWANFHLLGDSIFGCGQIFENYTRSSYFGVTFFPGDK